MKKELENMLCEYLGELMCDKEKYINWDIQAEILDKIRAVNLLLGYELPK